MLFLLYRSYESDTLVLHRGFPQLKVLHLSNLLTVTECKVEKGAMPCLHRLAIDWCKQLRALPDGLEDITTLTELTIHRMPKRFCSRVVEGGDDFYKIKHVPSVIITNITDDEDIRIG